MSAPALSLNTISEITGKLTASVVPADAVNKNVTWTSSNNAVATVAEDGTITPITAGNAIITATTVDGGFAATTNLNVTQATDQECVDFVYSKFAGYTGFLEMSPKILGENLNLDRIKHNLNLFGTYAFSDGRNSVAVQWAVSPSYLDGVYYINADGTVNRPELGWRYNAGSPQNPYWVERASADISYSFKKGSATSGSSGMGATVLPHYYIGDADGSQAVNIDDVLATLKSIVGVAKFDTDSIAGIRADVDGDGVVTVADAFYILKRSAAYRVGELD